MSLRLPTVTEFKIIKKFAEYYREYQRAKSRDQVFAADFRDFEDILANLGLAVRVRPSGEVEIPSAEGVVVLDTKQTAEDNYNTLIAELINLIDRTDYTDKQKEHLFEKYQIQLLDMLGLPRSFINPHKTLSWRKRKEIKLKAKKVNPKVKKAGISVFGEEELFNRWLRTKVRIFKRKMPLDLIQTREGQQRVLKVLAKLAH